MHDDRPPVSEGVRYCDAAMLAVGLAATALPFAGSHAEEAERWLRILRVSGAVGHAMQAIGVPEEPMIAGATLAGDPSRPGSLERLVEAAEANCRARQANAISTEDLLVAAHATYGAALDQALGIRGTTVAEVLERVETRRHTCS
jgi:uncharacterized alpha-E superfamily protein